MRKSKDPNRPNIEKVLNFPKNGKLLQRGDTYYVCTREYFYDKITKRKTEKREYLGRIAGNVFYTMEEYKKKFLNKGLLKQAKPLADANNLQITEAAEAQLIVRYYSAGATATVMEAAHIIDQDLALVTNQQDHDALLSIIIFYVLQPQMSITVFPRWSRIRALPLKQTLNITDLNKLTDTYPELNLKSLGAKVRNYMEETYNASNSESSLTEFLNRLSACGIYVCSDGSANYVDLLPEDEEKLKSLGWFGNLPMLCATCAKRD